MGSVLGLFFLGVLISALGVSNMRGNLSSIHWYHRQRVTEENKKPFGKQVGLGTLICGAALIIYSVVISAAEKTQNEWLTVAGSGVLVAAVVVGLALSFHAMIKYNRGIF